ncbi:hypothetical protein NO995_05245 [Aestuariibaculum sp. M13]|uniref:hypothetical protein n=1 Tax=Aestuariibaculum sp. M13 TaxID=2967132 RepID=UPI002159F2CB|nr:hypothetical protein [Aestuariibaculum sp. M13]MCR8667077.1 hypothetical protein [Aestuariibaculum sp. M13]
MAKTKVLITVKTYPSISTKYEETVCTAGMREDGTWIRIYPMPFRKLPYAQQYPKYQWIEMDLVKNKSDFRPESHRPSNVDVNDLICFGNKLDTKNKWAKRKEIVLQNIYTDLTKLIDEAKTEGKYTSLAVFKPTRIKNFIVEKSARDWSEKQKATLQQGNLFEDKSDFEVVKKLPYKFSYTFEDCNGRESTLMNEDWEVGALYWNCLKRNNGDEEAACADVKKKYWDDFAKTKDLYLFLGTTKLNQLRAPNPFVIIGTFYPPIELQQRLF